MAKVLMCESCLKWEVDIESSRGDKEYRVRFGRLDPEIAAVRDADFGWSCTCGDYEFRRWKGSEEDGSGHCKHIRQALQLRCGWHGAFDEGTPKKGKCPKCGCECVDANAAEAA